MELALSYSSVVTLHFLHSLKLCYWILSETDLFSYMYIIFSYITLGSSCMVHCNHRILSAWERGKEAGRFDYRKGREETELFKEKYPWIFFPLFFGNVLYWQQKLGGNREHVMTGSSLYIQLWCQSAFGLNPVKLQSRRYIAKQTGQKLSHVKHSKLKGLLSRHH